MLNGKINNIKIKDWRATRLSVYYLLNLLNNYFEQNEIKDDELMELMNDCNTFFKKVAMFKENKTSDLVFDITMNRKVTIEDLKEAYTTVTEGWKDTQCDEFIQRYMNIAHKHKIIFSR